MNEPSKPLNTAINITIDYEGETFTIGNLVNINPDVDWDFTNIDELNLNTQKNIFIESCFQLEEEFKPYLEINFGDSDGIKKFTFNYFCNWELIIQIGVFIRFMHNCKTKEHFLKEDKLREKTRNLLSAIMKYPSHVDYDEYCYDYIQHFFAENYKFNFANCCNGMSEKFKDLLTYIDCMHPMHVMNLEKFINGFIEFCKDKKTDLDQLCIALNIVNVFTSTNFIDKGVIDIPLIKPLIKDDFILESLYIKFYSDMNEDDKIGYEIGGKLNNKYTKLGTKGYVDDYEKLIKLIAIMPPTIMKNPLDFIMI